MNDKSLGRLADRLVGAAGPRADESDSEENCGAFGYLRGVRDRALMLELRLKDGTSVAFSYALLDRATFDPSDGIRLRFSDQEVHISGQALNGRNATGVGLYDAILRHRATWIQESGRADCLQAQTGAPIVGSITVDM